MNKLLFLILLFCGFEINAQLLVLKPGMTINRSVKIIRQLYKFSGKAELNSPVIIIDGNDITIDFNHATMSGNKADEKPDQFTGLAILIKGGKHITIKNLMVHGYKVALMAKDCDDLVIDNCDFGYNYRQHLNSSTREEDFSDWLSYHSDENDEWLRYGSAIYLRNCQRATIRDCHVTGGQNALMMVLSNGAQVYNNDFSFNSGIGMGLYRSSKNNIMYNRINFNVRGYSDGIYNRGQDSGGILVYEQSDSNIFYKNSATHSGDGFFLWAGQHTMNTAKGGCNDNLIMDNDFSYAPTNGIEVTFSRNKIIHNRIFECDNGIWAGYSFHTTISGNQFHYNHTGIAIEHGQDNSIDHNLFYQDKEAIHLWANSEDTSWEYPKHKDTRSRGYTLAANSFNENPMVYHLSNTDSLKIIENMYTDCPVIYKKDSSVTNIDSTTDAELLYELSDKAVPAFPIIANPADPFKGNGRLNGRKNIIITEWGPYNFKYPLIWNTGSADSNGMMHFRILGPAGRWKIVSFSGLDSFSRLSDSLPSGFNARRNTMKETDIKIIAMYAGHAFTGQYGEKIKAGKDHMFSFQEFYPLMNYKVSWYVMDSLSNFSGWADVSQTIDSKSFKSETVKNISYAWWGGIRSGNKSYPQFLTVAEGEGTFKEGMYELAVTYDHAVKVDVDGKNIMEEWNPMKSIFNDTPHSRSKLKLSAGIHHIHAEHVGTGAFATLQIRIHKLN